MDLKAIRAEFAEAARKAAEEFAAKYFAGKDGTACGFAWVTIYPQHKGNTKSGKLERQALAVLGFEKDWTGKAYELWNPSKWPGQSIDIKEAGARAAAEVLNRHGFRAFANSRLD